MRHAKPDHALICKRNKQHNWRSAQEQYQMCCEKHSYLVFYMFSFDRENEGDETYTPEN